MCLNSNDVQRGLHTTAALVLNPHLKPALLS